MLLVASILSPASGHASVAYVTGAMARINQLWESSVIPSSRL
jgi:hypothetical protein